MNEILYKHLNVIMNTKFLFLEFRCKEDESINIRSNEILLYISQASINLCAMLSLDVEHVQLGWFKNVKRKRFFLLIKTKTYPAVIRD